MSASSSVYYARLGEDIDPEEITLDLTPESGSPPAPAFVSGDNLKKHTHAKLGAYGLPRDFQLRLPDGLDDQFYTKYALERDPRRLNTMAKLDNNFFDCLRSCSKGYVTLVPLSTVVGNSFVSSTCRVVPKEVPPPYISDKEKLYRRDEAAIELASALLGCHGAGIIPVMDQAFGAGKTSLCFNFRRLLQQLDGNQRVQEIHSRDKYKALENATYVHVLMGRNGHDITQEKNVQGYITLRLASALSKCFPGTSSTRLQEYFESGADSVVKFIEEQTSGASLIFHFDEVQALEEHKSGCDALYELWFYVQILAGSGHFAIMTGRSRLLYYMGRNEFFKGKGSNISPAQLRHIQLPLLDEQSISALFKKRGLSQWASSKLGLQLSKDYTAGVPRFIHYLADHLVEKNEMKPPENAECGHLYFQSISTIVERLLSREISYSSEETQKLKEIANSLLDAAWLKLPLDPDETVVHDMQLHKALAAVGFYSTPSSVKPGCVEICVPRWMYKTRFNEGVSALLDISAVGDRLEIAARTVVALRSELNIGAKKWKDYGLDTLDELVPFVPLSVCRSLLPKFVKKGSSTDATELEKSMHGKGKTFQFSRNLLGNMYKILEKGKYYMFTPRSSSADACVKINDNTVLCFQFKNMEKKCEVAAEYAKCKADGWQVYLVIVYGCDTGITNNQFIELNGISCIVVLSWNSIQRFMGHNIAMLKSKSLSEEAVTDNNMSRFGIPQASSK